MNRWKIALAPIMAALLICVFSMAGCDILDVENPNNLIEDDLGNAAAADPMANGLEAAVTRALGFITAPYSVGTDRSVAEYCEWSGLDYATLTISADARNGVSPPVFQPSWYCEARAGSSEATSARQGGST